MSVPTGRKDEPLAADESKGSRNDPDDDERQWLYYEAQAVLDKAEQKGIREHGMLILETRKSADGIPLLCVPRSKKT